MSPLGMPAVLLGAGAGAWPCPYPSPVSERIRVRLDVVLAVVLTLVAEAELVWGGEIEPLAEPRRRAVAAVCVAAVTMVLARRRENPLAANLIAAAAVLLAGVGAADIDLVAVALAQFVLVYSAAVHAGARAALLALALALVSTAPGWQDAADPAFFGVLAAAAWAAGRVVRRQTRLALELAAANALLREERERTARLAADAERGRIARNLHDAVAHSLGIIVVQSELAQDALEHDPVSAREAVLAIARTARSSLQEVRGILGVLRTPVPREPALTELPALIASYRSSGLDVACQVSGAPTTLSDSVGTTAYLVAREALANVLRHAAGSTARVELCYDTDRLVLQVLDAGSGRKDSAPDRRGHGLVGIRERVALAGGTADIGDADEGGFRVLVVLPYGGVAR